MKRLLFCFTYSIFFLKIVSADPLSSIIGCEDTPHPLVQELIEHPAMQRMKEIDQSGVARYFLNLPSFQRYDHCVGVYMLLHRFNAPLDACVAGLLHDVSHTVFSHVADYLFRGSDSAHSYQDQIHLWYLKTHELDGLLSPYALTLNDVDPDQFLILEKPLLELCADRIEYNLHTGYLWGILSQEEVEEILQDLNYDEGIWSFQSQKIARKFAELPLHFNVTLWGGADNLIVYYWTSRALRRALEIGEISWDEIHFSTDLTVLNKLLVSADPQITTDMRRCSSFKECYLEVAPEEADVYIPIKFRGIDPWVKMEYGLIHLSELDAEFAEKFRAVKAFAEKGHHLKLKL